MDKSASLSPEVLDIVAHQGTEYPNTGRYNAFDGLGSYLCRRCGQVLFRSDHKFLSSCGWPSFDDELSGAIRRLTDKDGRRTEIRCQHCDAHLGHVFQGEGLTAKNLRHCVNSLAIDFVNSTTILRSEEAIVAAGCFWGVEKVLADNKGIVFTEVGYTGGETSAPTYDTVCHENTHHAEAVRVIYDPDLISYEQVIRIFFELHDPTQVDGQGPDHGEQYRSVIFYHNQQQQAIASDLIKQLKSQGLPITTQLVPTQVFWRAEEYHQQYYGKNNKQPYCHIRRPIFKDNK